MNRWFRNLRIGAKLTLGFSMMLIFTGVIGVTGYISIKTIAERLDEIFLVRMPSIDLIIEADRDLYQLLVAERSMLFTENQSERLAKLKAVYDENLQQSQERWSKYVALASTDEEKTLIPQFEKTRDEWKILSQTVVNGLNLGSADSTQERIALAFGAAEQKFGDMREYLNQLTDINLRLAAEAHQHAQATAKKSIIGFVVTAGSGLMIGIGLALIIGLAITTPLQKAVGIAKQLADGNLSQEIASSTTEETGQLLEAMKHMVETFKRIVEHVKAASQNIASGSEELSSAATQMVEGATSQAASTEELSSSMQEMAANIGQNSENAGQTEMIAINAAQEAHSAQKAMKKTTKAMTKISRQIAVIEEIAKQIRLLSLNATIEASKAEEYGKGFAVVASGVRELSGSTEIAAQKITKLVSAGAKKVNDTSDILSKLIPDIQKTAALVQEINAASREQHSGVAQINLATQQLDRSTQQHSAIAEELAATAQQLAAQAQQLQQIIAFFKDDAHEKQAEEQRVSSDLPPASPPEPSKRHITASANRGKDGASDEVSVGDERDAEFERF